MSRKVLLGYLCAATLLAGCATVHEKPATQKPADASPLAPAATQPVSPPRSRAVARPAPQETAPPAAVESRAQLPAMIGAGASWTSPGFQSLAVNRGASPQQPVSIFRQAGTLAAVRAALANSPAQPQAEFRNGVLTLKFDRGSNEEIAAAVNKTLSVTGSRNLQVALQP